MAEEAGDTLSDEVLPEETTEECPTEDNEDNNVSDIQEEVAVNEASDSALPTENETNSDTSYESNASVSVSENSQDDSDEILIPASEASCEQYEENESEEKVDIQETLSFRETEDEAYILKLFDELDDDKEDSASEDTPEQEPIQEEKEQEPYDPEKPRKVDVRFDFVELFVFTLAIVLFITSFIIRHSVVVGSSMENTLYEGERLLISDLFYTPDYYDIIVFEDYSTNVKTAVVKRVIGLPGDTIRITRSGDIYRNGNLLIETYVFIDDKHYQYTDMEITVPEGELFVMGDHRNNSDDSRMFGTIDEDSILGKVLLRFYPFSRFGTVD